MDVWARFLKELRVFIGVGEEIRNLVEAVVDNCFIECGPTFRVKRGCTTEEEVGMVISKAINLTFRGFSSRNNLDNTAKLRKTEGKSHCPEVTDPVLDYILL